MGSAALALLLDDRMVLSGMQWFLISVGFFLFQLDTKLFGAPTVYIVAARGIGVVFMDVHLFVAFDEIARVVPLPEIASLSERWSVLAPTRAVQGGILLLPVKRSGFTRLIDQILLVPTDPEQFLRQLPPALVIER